MPSYTEPLSGGQPANWCKYYLPYIDIAPFPTIYALEDKPAWQATTETTLLSRVHSRYPGAVIRKNQNNQLRISQPVCRPTGTRGD